MEKFTKYLIYMYFILFLSSACAQEKNNDRSSSEKPVLYLYVDKMPEFNSGNKNIIEFVDKNLKWPSMFDGNGTVVVSFVVKKDGSLENIKIEKSLHRQCDEETIRVIKLMPKWKAGELDGKPIDVIIYLPVRFFIR